MKNLNKIDQYFARTFNVNCFTNVYGLGRSLLAFGTLTTLVFSSPNILFDKDLFGSNDTGDLIDKLNFFFVLGFDNLFIAYAISIIVLLLVISGYYPRITGVLHWIVAFSFNNASALVDGGDQVAMVLSFFLIPITLMDNRKNHFYPIVDQNYFQKSVAVIITKIIIPLQMSFIYFHAATEKLYKVEDWRNGTALYYILDDPLFGSALLSGGLSGLLTNGFVVTSMTWGTILIEILLFGVIFMSYQRRKYFLFVGVGFHFMIIVIFGLVSFFCSMAAGVIIYTLDPAKPIDFKKYAWWKKAQPEKIPVPKEIRA